MTRYSVNATVSYLGWVYVEADSEEDAVDAARELRASEYEYDNMSGEVEFNVTPVVEVESE